MTQNNHESGNFNPCFCQLHSLMGITLAPSLYLYHQYIPAAAILSFALIAGPLTASMCINRESPESAGNKTLLILGPALYTGIWGLTG
jgi:hypothetical protein